MKIKERERPASITVMNPNEGSRVYLKTRRSSNRGSQNNIIKARNLLPVVLVDASLESSQPHVRLFRPVVHGQLAVTFGLHVYCFLYCRVPLRK